MSISLSSEQLAQEEQYRFPYHYLGLQSEMYRTVIHAHYLGKLQAALRLIGPLDGFDVLDFGCGDGRLCFEMNGRCKSLLGVDYSEAAIRFARAFNPEVSFQATPIEKMLGEERFDLITMIDVLEHIPIPEILELRCHLRRLLRPNGRLLVTVPSKNLPLSAKHYQHFDAQSLVNALAPEFSPVEIIGHLKGGSAWRKLIRRVNWAVAAWPFRRRIPLLRPLIEWPAEYVKQHSVVHPEHCHTLMGVFHRR